jgi:hypothetical protein
MPNLPEGEGVTTKVVWNPNEIWPFIGTRTFDASVATGAAQLNNCLTSPSTCVSHIYPGGEAGDSNSFSIFGYSQSATAASQVKAALIEKYKDNPESAPQDINFTFIGNPNRPTAVCWSGSIRGTSRSPTSASTDPAPPTARSSATSSSIPLPTSPVSTTSSLTSRSTR